MGLKGTSPAVYEGIFYQILVLRCDLAKFYIISLVPWKVINLRGIPRRLTQ